MRLRSKVESINFGWSGRYAASADVLLSNNKTQQQHVPKLKIRREKKRQNKRAGFPLFFSDVISRLNPVRRNERLSESRFPCCAPRMGREDRRYLRRLSFSLLFPERDFLSCRRLLTSGFSLRRTGVILPLCQPFPAMRVPHAST